MQSNKHQMYRFKKNIVWYSRYLGFSSLRQFKSHPKFNDFIDLYWEFTVINGSNTIAIRLRNMEIELMQK